MANALTALLKGPSLGATASIRQLTPSVFPAPGIQDPLLATAGPYLCVDTYTQIHTYTLS